MSAFSGMVKAMVENEYEKYDTIFNNINDFFEFLIPQIYFKQLDFIDDAIIEGLCGSGADGGCDAIYTLVDDKITNIEELPENVKSGVNISLYIFQSKYQTKFSEDVIHKWKTVCNNLLVFDDDMDLFEEFKTRYNTAVITGLTNFKSIYKRYITKQPNLTIKFVYASLGSRVSESLEDLSNELMEEVKSLYPSISIDSRVEFVGSEKINDHYNAPIKTPFTLKFETQPYVEDESNEYMGLMKLTNYFKMITKDNQLIKYIFDSNVRDYQGRNSVNKDIKETLENTFNNEEFWWLNNGVTILADEVSNTSGKTLVVKSPEIVNGLQTSYEIFEFFASNNEKLENENRKLLVRLIVPENEETRDNIIRATNNQTSIPKSSLKATDKIHRDIEQFFKHKSLFYDRRKNYYKNQGKKPTEIISIQFLAQCLISVVEALPDFARARPSTCLADDDIYNRLYNSRNPLESYYNIVHIGQQLNTELRSNKELTSFEKNDIIYFVLFRLVSKKLGKLKVNFNDLQNFDLESISNEDIQENIDYVYTEYCALGQSLKAGNGPKLTEIIEMNIRESIH